MLQNAAIFAQSSVLVQRFYDVEEGASFGSRISLGAKDAEQLITSQQACFEKKFQEI